MGVVKQELALMRHALLWNALQNGYRIPFTSMRRIAVKKDLLSHRPATDWQ
jgi:hypothetical protein